MIFQIVEYELLFFLDFFIHFLFIQKLPRKNAFIDSCFPSSSGALFLFFSFFFDVADLGVDDVLVVDVVDDDDDEETVIGAENAFAEEEDEDLKNDATLGISFSGVVASSF